MKKLFICLTIAFVFFAFKKNIIDTPIIDLSSDLPKKSLAISDIANDITYVPLQTTSDVLLGAIQHIEYYKNMLLILDKQDILYFFDAQNGQFIRKINRKGQGPGEYIRLKRFVISNSGTLLLFDDYRHVLLEYTTDGLYTGKSIKVGGASNIEVMGDLFVMNINEELINFNPSVSHKLFIKNDTSIISQYLPVNRSVIPQKQPPFVFNSYFCHFGEELLYYEPFDYNIYSVCKDSLSVKYKFFLGNNELKRSDTYDLQTYRDKRQYKLSFNSFIETKQFLFVKATFRNKSTIIAFDKKGNEAYTIESKGSACFENDKDGVLKLLPSLFYSDGKIINVFEANTIKEISISNINNNKYGDNLKKIIKSINEDDNPVLVIMNTIK
jgi:hypothetical protein